MRIAPLWESDVVWYSMLWSCGTYLSVTGVLDAYLVCWGIFELDTYIS